MFDYLIVGAGLYGATFAQQVMEHGKTCCIIDKRDHIAGNCYTEKVQGINVHRYGPHQFHTKSKMVWEYVNRFAEFNHFRAHVIANFDGELYSMPPNMRLFSQLFGVTTPQQARERIEIMRTKLPNPSNLEEWVQNQVGPLIYEMFYKGYSQKQWGKHPREIPASNAKRLPIRYTWNDRWFEDAYEGIPIGGYTNMVDNMIDGAEVMLNADYFEDRKEWHKMAKKVVYSGKIDQFFDYKHGELAYRSLRFETEVLDIEDYQGNSIVNYTGMEVPWTRIVEHKHFEFTKSPKTIITREYPDSYDSTKIPYYSVGDEASRAAYQKYHSELRDHPDVIVGGRLGSYQYYDMDQVIAQALKDAKMELLGPITPASSGSNRSN